MPPISVKTLTGRTVNVDVDHSDSIARIKAKVTFAEGILTQHQQNILMHISLRANPISDLPVERFVDVASGLELTFDKMVQEVLSQGARQLKLVLRKQMDEVNVEEIQLVAELDQIAGRNVLMAAGWPSGRNLENVSDEIASMALDPLPAFTQTFQWGGAGQESDMTFDISIAFGEPLIDREHGHVLNIRGLVYEAH